jgi:hypothetical protein
MAITSPVLHWLIVIQTVTLILLLVLYVTLSIFGVSSKDNQISTYDECVKASGSIIQESYPAICITKADVRFTQPLSDPTPTPAILP